MNEQKVQLDLYFVAKMKYLIEMLKIQIEDEVLKQKQLHQVNKLMYQKLNYEKKKNIYLFRNLLID